MFRKYDIRYYNFRLIIYLLAVSMFGVLVVGSAMKSLETRQLLGVILGFTIMLVLSFIDYSWILNFHWIIYLANAGLLLVVIIVGRASHGAQRWISVGGLTFQPIELSKILIILFFAWYFMHYENEISRPKVFFRTVLLIAVPLILIFVQPDLKNTITVVILFAAMYYVAGLSYKAIAAVVLIAVPLLIGGLLLVLQPDQQILSDYQRERIMTFLYPENDEYSDKAVQQKNSVTAIGSGELTGKGLNNSDVDSANKGNFISEIQTDFIFAVIGEETGFLGSAGVVILLLLIVLECLMISTKAKDMAGRVICTGMATVVAVQSFINIGVACAILPNTGTPLPFISYGLTSIVSLFIGMGLVLNVALQQKIPKGGRKRA